MHYGYIAADTPTDLARRIFPFCAYWKQKPRTDGRETTEGFWFESLGNTDAVY